MEPHFLSFPSTWKKNKTGNASQVRQICVNLHKSVNGDNKYSSKLIYSYSQSSDLTKLAQGWMLPQKEQGGKGGKGSKDFKKRTASLANKIPITFYFNFFIIIFTRGANNCGGHLMYILSTLYMFVYLLYFFVITFIFFVCFTFWFLSLWN